MSNPLAAWLPGLSADGHFPITFFIAPDKKQDFFGSATIFSWQRCQNALMKMAALPTAADVPAALSK
ncbi:hypothetical protein [Rhizobium leguminosarum]|uniref:hypothetical protein n=1 Tax=Rhizobium leguminosarum TaxID=384 RepID=UPI0013BB5F89|nr:hypothetical protein [Rhizobium leguminosarum]MBY5425265.1 hypothetical protein [Rhizobium leguminosarum]NEH42004.1 hypothetical protein [Rhizobium leguminosarum]NKL19066.1 hypothetical protein [Rhizobium leguminosarum bv. viciae]NKL53645.1 hypothetical protein [Rhizobium leguminosarum bv. viciae]